MKSSAKKIELASVDDLFSTEEGRQDAKLEKIQEIPLSELHPFRNHPFKVKDDEAMMETADSIKQYGVLVPAIARPDPEGGYGKERLSQLHAVFHMDEQLPFQFEWDWLAPSGLSTKDFIAPSSFEFRTGKQFRMGKKYGAVSFLQILAPELNDRLLADFLDMESSLIVSIHIQSVDQVKAIKTVKRKITDLDRSKIEEQKKAVRAGYDMDISATRS